MNIYDKEDSGISPSAETSGLSVPAEDTTPSENGNATSNEVDAEDGEPDTPIDTTDDLPRQAASLEQQIEDGKSKLSEPETGNYEKVWPTAVVRRLKKAAVDTKHPERGGVDLASIITGTENSGKLKSRLATKLEPAKTQSQILGEFLDEHLSVLIGSPDTGATNLALAVAKAVAQGGTVLGETAKPAPVLYVDPVRPEEAIVAALGEDDLATLGNLLVMARGTTDFDIKNEIANLKTLGVNLALVVINEFGRIMTEHVFKSVVGDTETRYLAVVPGPKFKTRKIFPKHEKSQAIDMTEQGHVIYLEPAQEETVRLTILKYGEVVKDVAVDSKDNWKPLGKPKEGIKGKRQIAVFETVKEAGEEGIEPRDVAALLDVTPNNAYQALLSLTRSNAIFKSGKRYYLKGVMPKEPGQEKAA